VNPPSSSPSLPGINLLLMGESGSGKTYSSRTWVDAGLETFVLAVDPGLESINDIPCEKGLHYVYFSPMTASWDSLTDSAAMLNMFPMGTIADQPKTKFHMDQYTGWKTLMGHCKNFVCQRCGQSFGDICSWGPNRALVFDGLSGISQMAMQLIVGSKPVKSMPETGAAMELIYNFITKITSDKRCHLMLISHVEKEFNENTNEQKLMPSTLGRKLAPKLPKLFSDVIWAKRVGPRSFEWDNASTTVEVKSRNFEISAKLPPTVAPAVKKWLERGGLITPSTKP
jgi:hypothetical protein